VSDFATLRELINAAAGAQGQLLACVISARVDGQDADADLIAASAARLEKALDAAIPIVAAMGARP
jgi:hypothetical protein